MPTQAGSELSTARVHPNRGPGYFYAVLALLVLAGVLGGIGTNLARGKLLLALVTLLVGALVTGFLALLSLAILGPVLEVGPDGVRGRISLRRPVELSWAVVDVTVEEGAPTRRFTFRLGTQSLTIDARSWTGFRELVLVLATTPAAVDRLSPSARAELVRLLGVAEAADPELGEPAAPSE